MVVAPVVQAVPAAAMTVICSKQYGVFDRENPTSKKAN